MLAVASSFGASLAWGAKAQFSYSLRCGVVMFCWVNACCILLAKPAAKQEFILSAIKRASQYDETPAVRSAACRAVGVIVGFPQVSKRAASLFYLLQSLLLGSESHEVRECAASALQAPAVVEA